MDSTEQLGRTRDALACATERVAPLIASIPDPLALAPDSPWTVRDFAAHLVVCGSVFTDMAQGVPSPIQSREPAYFNAEVARRNADIAETDPRKLSRLFGDGMEGFLDAAGDSPGDAPVVFHCGDPLTLAGISGVLLGEVVLHGYDIATAIGRPWPPDLTATQLVLAAYAPALGFIVDPEASRGHSAGYRIELRGLGEMTVRFTDGVFGLEEAGAAPVDATICADPVAFLMVVAGRLSRYQAFALGQLSVGGDHPGLAIGFWDLFRYP